MSLRGKKEKFVKGDKDKQKAVTLFSKDRQPSPEARRRGQEKARFNRRMEENLLYEMFVEDIEIINKEGQKVFTSGMTYGIKKLKNIMLTTKNEKLACDIFFKFMDRMFGKPQISIETSVSQEPKNYNREDIIQMILEARNDKVIDIKPQSDFDIEDQEQLLEKKKLSE